MTPPSDWRRAAPDEVLALMELEREANLAALGHVFPGPFPEDDVMARWAIVLDDPTVRVEVVDGPGGLRAVTAYDDSALRHLFVHPDSWGQGLGREGVARAVAAVGPGIRLWVLDANHRARRLYEHLGWTQTGQQQESVWPPHPTELGYVWTGTTIQLLRVEDRDELLAFERENREWFARSIPDRGDAFFAEFDDRLAERLQDQADGIDRYFIVRDEQSHLIGRVNFMDVTGGLAALGYRFAESATGRGRAGQAVRLGIEEMARRGVTEFRASTTVSNLASQRVLEKCGFVRVDPEPGDAIELGGGHGRREPAVHYRWTADSSDQRPV